MLARVVWLKIEMRKIAKAATAFLMFGIFVLLWILTYLYISTEAFTSSDADGWLSTGI